MPLGKRAQASFGGQNKTHFPQVQSYLLPNMISPHFSEERGFIANTDFHKHAFLILSCEGFSLQIRKDAGEQNTSHENENIF